MAELDFGSSPTLWMLNGPKRTVACLLNSSNLLALTFIPIYLSSREQFSRTPAYSRIVRVLNSGMLCPTTSVLPVYLANHKPFLR